LAAVAIGVRSQKRAAEQDRSARASGTAFASQRTVKRLLRYGLSAVVLVSIALSAYLQASAAMQLLGAAVAADENALGAGAARSLRAPAEEDELGAPPAEKTAKAILSRNPFDSVTGSLIDQPSANNAESALAANTDPLLAPVCDGIRLAMVTESRDPEWSMASLQVAGESAARLLRPGDEVTGKQIAYIGHNPRENSPAVWLTANSSLCQALLFAALPTAAAAAAHTPASPPATAAPAAGALAPALAEIALRIKKLSDTEFEADRSVIDIVLKNQDLLMRGTRIVPEQKDGKVLGIRLFGMRSDTLLGVLGFQNGDRLESINGVDMISPEKMLEAYARLPAASRLTVRINRRGQPVSIDYRLK
jgi:general secretion pathway protein C